MWYAATCGTSVWHAAVLSQLGKKGVWWLRPASAFAWCCYRLWFVCGCEQEGVCKLCRILGSQLLPTTHNCGVLVGRKGGGLYMVRAIQGQCPAMLLGTSYDIPYVMFCSNQTTPAARDAAADRGHHWHSLCCCHGLQQQKQY